MFSLETDALIIRLVDVETSPMDRIYPLLFTCIVLHALHPSLARAQGEDVCPSSVAEAKPAIVSSNSLR